MEQSACNLYYARIGAAPLAARGFFESVEEHFRLRNDVDVRSTHPNVEDMRLRAVWKADAGKPREQVFAKMTWQPKNLAVFARTKLTPEEFTCFDFEGAEKPKADKEPRNREIHLFEGDWR